MVDAPGQGGEQLDGRGASLAGRRIATSTARPALRSGINDGVHAHCDVSAFDLRRQRRCGVGVPRLGPNSAVMLGRGRRAPTKRGVRGRGCGVLHHRLTSSTSQCARMVLVNAHGGRALLSTAGPTLRTRCRSVLDRRACSLLPEDGVRLLCPCGARRSCAGEIAAPQNDAAQARGAGIAHVIRRSLPPTRSGGCRFADALYFSFMRGKGALSARTPPRGSSAREPG